MQPLAVTIENFSFPSSLDKSKANFRFVIELNYFNRLGNPTFATGAVPAVDSYWECDWTKANARPPRYVGPRPGPRGGKPEAYGTIDQAKLNPHQKLAMLVNTNGGLYSLNCTLLDVDRRDFWDLFLEKLSGAVEPLLGQAAAALPDSIETPEGLRGAIARKLAGPGDRIIGSQGVLLENRLGEHEINIRVAGGDYKGDYAITLQIAPVISPS